MVSVVLQMEVVVVMEQRQKKGLKLSILQHLNFCLLILIWAYHQQRGRQVHWEDYAQSQNSRNSLCEVMKVHCFLTLCQQSLEQIYQLSPPSSAWCPAVWIVAAYLGHQTLMNRLVPLLAWPEEGAAREEAGVKALCCLLKENLPPNRCRRQPKAKITKGIASAMKHQSGHDCIPLIRWFDLADC